MSAPVSDPLVLRIPRLMGAAALSIGEQLGGVMVLLGRIVARLLPPRLDRPELVRNLHKMGVRSLPIVSVTALFVGAIMGVRTSGMLMVVKVMPWSANSLLAQRVQASSAALLAT